MKHLFAAFTFFTSVAAALAAEKPRVVATMNALPMALNSDFGFRKSKLFHLTEVPPPGTKDTSLNFERAYRLHGAVTGLDSHQRFGDYFDFFWRAKRDADLTVRFEYRQEKLRSFVQAREISYARVRGTHRTEFSIIGDDYFDDGRVTAWRCLLIERGRIVAENRSYLWQ